jgi:hypothetical protein
VIDDRQHVHRLLETESGEIEDLAASWISEKEPRYIIWPQEGQLISTFGASYGGQMFVSNLGRLVPVAGRRVTALIYGTRIVWEEARKYLESGHTYFGHIEITIDYNGEVRNGQLSSTPLYMAKIGE